MRTPVSITAAHHEPDGTTTVIVACDDGAVFTAALNSHAVQWYALPPIPGTAADRAKEEQ